MDSPRVTLGVLHAPWRELVTCLLIFEGFLGVRVKCLLLAAINASDTLPCNAFVRARNSTAREAEHAAHPRRFRVHRRFFSALDTDTFRFPYLLPNLVASGVALLAVPMSHLLLRETHPVYAARVNEGKT